MGPCEVDGERKSVRSYTVSYAISQLEIIVLVPLKYGIERDRTRLSSFVLFIRLLNSIFVNLQTRN